MDLWNLHDLPNCPKPKDAFYEIESNPKSIITKVHFKTYLQSCRKILQETYLSTVANVSSGRPVKWTWFDAMEKKKDWFFHVLIFSK